MTPEMLAYMALAFGWGFVSALWLHGPIVRAIHRAVETAVAARRDKRRQALVSTI